MDPLGNFETSNEGPSDENIMDNREKHTSDANDGPEGINTDSQDNNIMDNREEYTNDASDGLKSVNNDG